MSETAGSVKAVTSPNPPRRVLAHMCCGPCSVAPLKAMLKGDAEVWGFFHNPNIHPYSEFKRRLEAVKTLSRLLSMDCIIDRRYMPTSFIKGVRAASKGNGASRMPRREDRCPYCYLSRLKETAKAAVENGFDAFTSSLLYSRYQMHDEIRAAGIEAGRLYGVAFYYEDFRPMWQEGIDGSKGMGLYRQKYCGCIYSRLERYSAKKKNLSTPEPVRQLTTCFS